MAKKSNPWKIGVLATVGLAALGGVVYGGIELHEHLTKPVEEAPEEIVETPEDNEDVTTESAVMANYMAAIQNACA